MVWGLDRENKGFERCGMLEFADKVIEPSSSLKLCHSKSSKPGDSVFRLDRFSEQDGLHVSGHLPLESQEKKK